MIDIFRSASGLKILLNGDTLTQMEFQNKVTQRIPDSIAMDYLFHSGIVCESDQGFLELGEKFKSPEALSALISHVKKFLVFYC
jgi:hypothetical protein